MAEGGELEFVKKIIHDSLQLKKRLRWWLRPAPNQDVATGFRGFISTSEAALKTVIQGNTATCENYLGDEQELCTFVLFGKVWRGLNGWRVPRWSGDTNKWANGLMHIDGAGLMILAHNLPILCPGPAGNSCAGRMGWLGSPAAVTLPSPLLQALSPGQWSATLASS